MNVNKNLLPLKAHFFFYSGSIAPILPFVLVIAVQLGIPVSLQTSVSAFSILFTLLGKPLVAALADVFPSHRKAIFLVILSIMVASYSSINFIPPIHESFVLKGELIDLEAIALKGADGSLSPAEPSGLRIVEDSDIVERGSLSANHSLKDSSRERAPDSLQSHVLLFVADNDSDDPYVTGGSYCSIACTPMHCPFSLSEEESKNFTLRLIRNSSRPQQLISYNSSITRGIVSPFVNITTHSIDLASISNLYQIEGLNISRVFAPVNISIECATRETVQMTSSVGSRPEAWKSWQFWLLAVLLISGETAFSIVVSITDAIAVDSVGNDGSYGIQRAWGTIGFGIMASLNGILVDWWSAQSNIKNYGPAFLICFTAGVIDVMVCSLLLKVPEIKEEKGILQNLRPLLREKRFIVFCCFVVLNGCLDGIAVNFVSIMQEDLARGTKVMDNLTLLQGLTSLIQCAAEVPFMFLCGRLIKKIGVRRVTSLVFFLYIFRLFGLFITGRSGYVWTTMIPELLSGPCYGLGFTANVVYGAMITPPGVSNTVQSLINICFATFGYSLSMFFGGLVYDKVGGPYMYVMASGLAVLTFVCHIVSLKILPQPKEDNEISNESKHQQEISHDQEESRAFSE